MRHDSKVKVKELVGAFKLLGLKWHVIDFIGDFSNCPGFGKFQARFKIESSNSQTEKKKTVLDQ